MRLMQRKVLGGSKALEACSDKTQGCSAMLKKVLDSGTEGSQLQEGIGRRTRGWQEGVEQL